MLALPGHFSSRTSIEGVAATDLFALNTVLATTIEVQVVETLNRMRSIWDPDGEWKLFHFLRQAQTFPDVLLQRPTAGGGRDVVLGIELKGWYLLSKEGVPSFRYMVTPAACSPRDLLAVVPWHLGNVMSGTPTVRVPGVWSALHAASYRNHWWTHLRRARSSSAIASPEDARPYSGRASTSDRPASDQGRNFGRIARIGIMKPWIREQQVLPIAGIPTKNWIAFLRQHAEGGDLEDVFRKLQRELEKAHSKGSDRRVRSTLDALRGLRQALPAAD